MDPREKVDSDFNMTRRINSFICGVGSLVDIYPLRSHRPSFRILTDDQLLAQAWELVGQSLRCAFARGLNEHGNFDHNTYSKHLKQSCQHRG
jgi:hypothetical protein